MAKNQHVIPQGDRWAVRGAGNHRASRVYATQAEAIGAARAIARSRGVDLVIHGSDGRIRAKTSYGTDPYPPRP